MKIILAVIFLSMSLASQAGDYTSAVEKQERCKASGELAQSVRGVSKELVMKSLDDAKARVRAKQLSKAKYDEFGQTIMAGVTAKSDREAYMRGWAICMDSK